MLFNLENFLGCFDIIFRLLYYLLFEQTAVSFKLVPFLSSSKELRKFFFSVWHYLRHWSLIKWKGDPVFRMFVLFRIPDCVQSAESSIPNCDVPLLDPF